MFCKGGVGHQSHYIYVIDWFYCLCKTYRFLQWLLCGYWEAIEWLLSGCWVAIACFRLLQYAIFMAVAWLLRVFDYYSMQSSWLLRAERGTKLFHAHSLLRFTTLSVIAVWRFMYLCLSLFACTKITIANSSTSGPWKVPFKKCEAPEKALLNKSILLNFLSSPCET